MAENNSKGKYYITTAIAYASGKPHIGNTYEVVLADAIARYKRLEGYDVFFMTGTDEHGEKVELKAAAEGVSPKEYVDRVAGEVRRIWDLMNTSYNKFMRTTDEDHVRAVQHSFEKLYRQGDIYKGRYEGWYCVPCESFWTESQLVDGKCPDCGRPVTRATEDAYFFRMSKYQDRLMKYIEEHPDFIEPESRRKEMVNNFLKPGLQDLCVSRSSFTWGIPVTFDQKHVVYVWLDALMNYITGIGYDTEQSTDQYRYLWPADLHLIGKDILRFHTIYWPIFLMALGQPLPKQIFGHPWMLMNNDKMSKSKGNLIYADDMVERFGVDAVRYYMLHEMPFAADGNITYANFLARYNSDLANTLGNLVNRTVTMQHKYFNGILQNPSAPEPLDQELSALAQQAPQKVAGLMKDLHIADSIEVIMELSRRCNKYIDETSPWALAKDGSKKERLGTVLYNLMESIRYIGVLLIPYLPDTGKSILDQAGAPEELRTLDSLAVFGGLRPGACVGTAAVLFQRQDEKKVLAELEEADEKRYLARQAAENSSSSREAAAKAASAVKISGTVKVEEGKPAQEKKSGSGAEEGSKAEITIDDFEKVELKVGEVLECRKVEKSKKLLCSQVRIGDEVRQIVSGIAKYYTPEEMVGRKVIVVTNLKPATLAGTLSQGMILCASDANGGFCLVQPEKDVPSGSTVS